MVKKWYKFNQIYTKAHLKEGGPVARSGAEETLQDSRIFRNYFSEEGVFLMKWQLKQTYWKVAVVLGAIASFVLASGAGEKWG